MNRKAGTLYPTTGEWPVLIQTGKLGGNAEFFRPIFLYAAEDFFLPPLTAEAK